LASSRIIKKNQVLVVGLASFFYGVIIEVAQALFTMTRKADVVDVFANSVGTIAACFVAVYIIHRSKETNLN
jgi:VanZ family protein